MPAPRRGGRRRSPPAGRRPKTPAACDTLLVLISTSKSQYRVFSFRRRNNNPRYFASSPVFICAAAQMTMDGRRRSARGLWAIAESGKLFRVVFKSCAAFLEALFRISGVWSSAVHVMHRVPAQPLKAHEEATGHSFVHSPDTHVGPRSLRVGSARAMRACPGQDPVSLTSTNTI